MANAVFTQSSLHGNQNFNRARVDMVKQQIRTWDVSDPKILSLFYDIHREDFVPEAFKTLAFADISIPLPNHQSMMPPKEEARILQSLSMTSKDKAIVMGADTGFVVTLLSHLAGHVYYLNNEIDSFEDVQRKVIEQKLTNVTCLMGKWAQGWAEHIPFDVILVTGSLPAIPDELRQALAIGGRLFVVVGDKPVMEAMRITRLSENTWNEIKLFETDRPRMPDVKELHEFIF